MRHTRPRALHGLALTLCLAAAAWTAPPKQATPPAPHYLKDIRPALGDACLSCHGFDEAKRQGGLRLDAPLSPRQAREVARRLAAPAGSPLQMPPAGSGKTLTADARALLVRWAKAGAPVQSHWAFVKPVRPAVPQLPPRLPRGAGGVSRLPRGAGGVNSGSSWGSPIDAFVRARLAKEGLKPSPEADRRTLIRRVSLDLTGLPPTPEEVDAFVADRAPNAFEKVVDRLLASPRYGEKMAQVWLDGARYADSNGYQADFERFQWRWRDWVIDAYNRNLPFDRFTVQQLAGDLLPNATLEQKIATGFNRNHRINTEGGVIAEEWRVENVVDRLETTGAVWLGLTVGCGRCHGHKYDPITQKEFYGLFAYFNNVPESGIGAEAPVNHPPIVRAPGPQDAARLAACDTEIARAEAAVKAAEGQPAAPNAWRTPTPAATAANGTRLTPQPDGSVRADGPNPATEVYTVALPVGDRPVTGVRLEALPEGGQLARSVNGNFVLTDLVAEADGKPVRLARASADFSQPDFGPEKAIDSDAKTGWAVFGQTDRPHTALFIPERPVDARTLTVRMTFGSEYGQHQLVRFRLSLTDAADPSAAEAGPLADARSALAAARKKRADAEAAVPTVMVMDEMAQPRDCFVLIRGQYDQRGEKVAPGIPAALGALPAGAPNNRLGFARWIASPDNPLTARVAVNRLWEKFFGVGIVATSEDFGVRAEYPSHPELLDWLATEFVRLGWDLKAIQKQIVLSQTYRQSSRVTPELLRRDPENRLLARGPRFRLPAEAIRDQALFASGLLVEKIGGPSVRPYQPDGVWDELNVYGNLRNYKHDTGSSLYRRTLYTIWKRTAAPPQLTLFDVPGREACRVRRSRTNTPLQALVLLNDPTYVEASRALAERALGAGPDTGARLDTIFRRVLGRRPSIAERWTLEEGIARRLDAFRARPDDAKKLLSVGDTPADPKRDPAELAAWTLTASVVLNLDEAVTKE